MTRSALKGFTIIEVLVATVVLVLGLLVIVTSFGVDLRHSAQTREKQLALFVAENLLEEIAAHPFGLPKPKRWGSRELPQEYEFFVVVDGRQVQNKYKHFVEYGDGATGSFFGHSKKDFDRVRVVISWREQEAQGNFEVRTLEFETDVWRQSDTLK